MSKNFELLQQAGWHQEYFDGLPSPPLTENRSTPVLPERLPIRNDPTSALIRKVFLDSRESRARMVMFCGVARGVGCTWTCANTAKALANSVAGRICVIDANFAVPSLHSYFSAQLSAGFSDALLESAPPQQFAVQFENTNLWFLPAGLRCKRVPAFSDNSLLESHFRELRSAFDYLLVDVAALPPGPLAKSIGRVVDGAVLVLESSGIAANALLQARKLFHRARVQLFGVVLNQRTPATVLDRLLK